LFYLLEMLKRMKYMRMNNFVEVFRLKNDFIT
jgi:hypothetical protein